MKHFAQVWQTFYPAAPPVGFLMRQSASENWVRFHALPGSKRYADSEHEREIILSRAKALARRILSDETRFWICEASPSSAESSSNCGLPFAFSFHEEDEDIIWNFYAGFVEWDASFFDNTIRSIAEDEGPRVLWMSAESGSVFAPYDGGFDLFLSSSDEAKSLKTEHSDWLSGRSDGL
jgi:hypothetical protein